MMVSKLLPLLRLKSMPRIMSCLSLSMLANPPGNSTNLAWSNKSYLLDGVRMDGVDQSQVLRIYLGLNMA